MTTETDKLVIAIEYLDTAATLWLHETNYFSAMHLAGAAEELSGKACRIAKTNSHFDDLRLRVQQALSAMGIEHTEKQLKEAAYGAKNAIKHMNNRNDTSVSINPREYTANYIMAAYRNFEKLGLQDELSETVRKVVDTNTVRLD